MGTQNKMAEAFLDAAAGEALGCATREESAAYQQELANAGEDAKKTDRALREVVARMAAASPHMTPPAGLRGRILQATAPATFRMEDYRKATRDNSRFYKWGFYAAMMFLMAAAGYNIDTRNTLTKESQRTQGLAAQLKQRDEALTAFVNPKAQQITLEENGKAIAKVIADPATHKAVVIVAEGSLPPGKGLALTLPENGKSVAYETTTLTAPGAFLTAPQGTMMQTAVNVTNLMPDDRNKPQVAGTK